MSALLELGSRCEAASGPDRELDGWIWARVKQGEKYLVGHRPGRFPQEPIYGERLDVMRKLTADPSGAADYIGAPLFTSSVDAAMSLASGLEEFGSVSGLLREAMDRIYLSTFPKGDLYADPQAYREVLARFFTAACLRARAQDPSNTIVEDELGRVG